MGFGPYIGGARINFYEKPIYALDYNTEYGEQKTIEIHNNSPTKLKLL